MGGLWHRALRPPSLLPTALASQLLDMQAAMASPALPAANCRQVSDHLKKRYGRRPARILSAMLGSKGGVSGGTVAR